MNSNILEKAVEYSIVALWLTIGIVIGTYAMQFQGQPISGNPEHWGQFGDYVGGILNPLVALGAFSWLAISVRLQKKELSETRTALQESQKAQQKQAQTGLHGARIQTLNIQLSIVASRLSQMQQYLSMLYVQQGTKGPACLYYDEFGKPSCLADVISNLARRIKEERDEEIRILAFVDILSREFADSTAGEAAVEVHDRIYAGQCPQS